LSIAGIKSGLLRLVPPQFQHFLKKLYFPGVVRNFSRADWPYGEFVDALVEKGDCVVDAGANIGYITGLLSEFVGGAGRVYSFEPVPETYDLLTNNIRKLGLQNVSAYRVAASSRSGEAQMEIPHFAKGPENFYQSHVIDGTANSGENRRISVDLVRLDDVLAEHVDAITFMKIDVEGHELDLIRGATKLLSESRPSLLIEVIGDADEPGSGARSLFDALQAYGYEAYLGAGGRLRKRRSGDRAVDYLFLERRHLELLENAAIPID
jgi:FkbM family methyltransferase